MSVPKLRFKEFKGDWEVKKLGEIALKVGSGSTPRGGESVYQSNGIPFIRSQNVKNESLILDDLVYISEDINSRMQGSIVKSDDILLNITGASIGRSCVVPSNFKIGNVNQHVCIIRLNPNYISRFIQPYLSSERGQKSILSSSVGSGREGLNFQAIRLFKIAIPTHQEQTKIADFLMTVDEKIAQLTQKCELLARYKKGVMQQLFSQELRFKDDDGRDFPDWEEKLFGEIADIRRGASPRP
ncbi:MAG: restriction endonuclease subunit S, partial [Dolichospermum sp.]